MTTSRQPWTIQQATDGNQLIMDADGKAIGMVFYWQNAELIINSVADPNAVEHWKSECELAQEERDELEKELAKKDKEVESLEKELTKKDKEIESLEDEIAKKDKEVESLEDEIASLKFHG
jgi:peptidoglycan hydrolase CwlO-like protein